MAHLKANFAQGTLDGTLAQSAAQLTLNAGHSMPTSAGTFQLVIWDNSEYSNPADDPDVEIVTGEYSSPNVYDITRAQEGTADVEHGANHKVGLHFTAAVANEFIATGDDAVLGSLACTGSAAYGLDLSGGTWATGDINLVTDPTVYGGGSRVLKFDSGANHNFFLGQDCFKDEDGSFNLGIGEHAGENNSVAGGGNNGTTNLFIGYEAGKGAAAGMTGYSNLAIGYVSMDRLTSGYDNCAVGTGSLRLATTAYQCMAFGDATLYSCTQGHDNVAVGYNAGNKVSTGDYHVFIGSGAGDAVSTNSGDVAIGASAWTKGTGSQNTILGATCAANIVSGDDNVIIGSVAFFGPTAGHRNIIVGRLAARRQSGTVSDMLMFDNRDRTTGANELTQAIIHGTMAALPADQTLQINGELTLTAKPLALSGDARVTNALWIDAGGLKAPGLKPATAVAHGLLETPAWSFGDENVEANEETVTWSMRVPNRMDRIVAPTMSVGWSADASSPGVCEWQLEYLWTAAGEDTGAAAQETLYADGTAPVTADGLVVTSFSGIDVPGASDACLHCRLKRLSSASAGSQTDTIAIDVHLHGVCYKFTSNKLGVAI